MSFKEAVVNMFSKTEKFKYKLTVLAVGRGKSIVVSLYLRRQLVEDQNQYRYSQSATGIFQKLIQTSCGTDKLTKINLVVASHCFRESCSVASV